MNNSVPLIIALAKPDQAMVSEAVNDWLGDHPEATTTVQDGAITKAKLATALQTAVDSIPAVDANLDTSGAAADAKKTGDELSGVKTQLSEITDKITTCVMDTDTTFLNGYLDSDGAFVPASTTQRTSDFVAVESGIPYTTEINVTYDTSTLTAPRAMCLYKADKTLSRKLSMPTDMSFTPTAAEKYVRLNYNGTLNSLALYPYAEGKVSYTEVNGMTALKGELANVSAAAGINYFRARRPIISFIIDGDNDLNATVEQIFKEHGYAVGFAPQYTLFTPDQISAYAASYKNYLTWQANGHEILSHLTYVLDEETSYTDEEAIAIIKASFRTMKSVGFSVHGAIGSAGAVAERFIPYIKKLYDYAATANNKSGSATPTLGFLTDSPYGLWRYSMQLSTLAEMKAAVDSCITNNALLLFYGHAKSQDAGNFTVQNLEALLTYIDAYVDGHEVSVQTPFNAIRDFYSLRYDDYISLLTAEA